MSGFATVDEAFQFVSERPTLLERLYERKASKTFSRPDVQAIGKMAEVADDDA